VLIQQKYGRGEGAKLIFAKSGKRQDFVRKTGREKRKNGKNRGKA